MKDNKTSKMILIAELCTVGWYIITIALAKIFFPIAIVDTIRVIARVITLFTVWTLYFINSIVLDNKK